MINLRDIYLQYGDRVIFNYINLTVKPTERVGLIGRNGAGKSTLIKIIAKEISSDEGVVDIPKTSSVGYLAQSLSIPETETVLNETLKAFDHIEALEKRLEEINTDLGIRTDYESDEYMDLITEVSNLTEQLNTLDAGTKEAETVKVLTGLGFTDDNIHNPVASFSGGWKMRVELAKLLLKKPEILLLDEPTNHLDIESIIWLEKYIKNYYGIVIVISHDEEFLDNVCNRTVEIEYGKLYDFKTNYSGFKKEKEQLRSILESTVENQKREIAEKERLIEKFRAKANKAKFAQSLIKQLDRMERLDNITEDKAVMKLKFPPAPRSGRVVCEASNIWKAYGDNAVLNGVDLTLERGDKVAFVGQNGQGKSTLAKIVTQTIAATKGEVTLGHNVEIGYYAQDAPEQLDGDSTLLQTIEDQAPPHLRPQARKMLGAFMFSGEDVDKKVRVLSGGEKSRLALACLIMQDNNFLIFDEPTNHLDMLSKERLKEALNLFDGTLLVVSHDRSFLTGLTDKTYEFRDKKIREYLGDVTEFLKSRETESFRDIEQKTEKKKEKVVEIEAPPKPTKSQEEYKTLQRKLQYAERDIEKIEKEIAKLEAIMSDPEFYSSPDVAQVSQKHTDLKSSLTQKMEDWEAIAAEME